MIALDDYQALIRKVEKLKQRYNEAVGEKKQLVKRLKKEFGVSSLQEAIDLLEDLKDKEITHLRKYTKKKLRFEKRWAKQLRET